MIPLDDTSAVSNASLPSFASGKLCPIHWLESSVLHVLFCASVIRDTKDCTWSTVRATDLRGRDHQPLKRMFQTLSWSIEWKGPYLNLHTYTEECPASCLKHVELSYITFVFSALYVDLPSKHVTWSVAKDWSFGCGKLLVFSNRNQFRVVRFSYKTLQGHISFLLDTFFFRCSDLNHNFFIFLLSLKKNIME